MKALNRTSGRTLALDLAVASSFLARAQGLLGKRSLGQGAGLWIRPCSAVHTLGMRFSIDVLFLDSWCRVVGQARGLRPNRLAGWFPGGDSVLELPAGTLEASETTTGDRIDLL